MCTLEKSLCIFCADMNLPMDSHKIFCHYKMESFNDIEGLSYSDSIISEDEERILMTNIDLSEWNSDLKRRTQHYGYRYPYAKPTSLIPCDPIPSFLMPLIQRIGEMMHRRFDQVIINEYVSYWNKIEHHAHEVLLKRSCFIKRRTIPLETFNFTTKMGSWSY